MKILINIIGWSSCVFSIFGALLIMGTFSKYLYNQIKISFKSKSWDEVGGVFLAFGIILFIIGWSIDFIYTTKIISEF